MEEFGVNGQREDPYKSFEFRVKWDGRYVAGLSEAIALRHNTEPVEHREGGDATTSRKLPGLTKYQAIALEKRVTHDAEFQKWAIWVWNVGSGPGTEMSRNDF